VKYSIFDGERVAPFPKGKGICPVCASPTQVKCGKRKIWHWAHESLQHCDRWWENETEWHRAWKSLYPEEWQEVVHFDEVTQERHISDVRTDKNLFVEFQNSPMSEEELASRERFYKNLIWVVNGHEFKKNFHILHKLPNPICDFVQDIVFHLIKYNHQGRLFHRKSENSNRVPGQWNLVHVHSISEIQDEIEQNYIGHHLFDWVKPRKIWYLSGVKIYFDFGSEALWNMQTYDERGLICVQSVSKRSFIEKMGGDPTKIEAVLKSTKDQL